MSVQLCLTSAPNLPQVAPKSASGGRPKGLPMFVNPLHLGPILNRVFQSQSDSSRQEAGSTTTSGRFLAKRQKRTRSWSRIERRLGGATRRTRLETYAVLRTSSCDHLVTSFRF